VWCPQQPPKTTQKPTQIWIFFPILARLCSNLLLVTGCRMVAGCWEQVVQNRHMVSSDWPDQVPFPGMPDHSWEWVNLFPGMDCPHFECDRSTAIFASITPSLFGGLIRFCKGRSISASCLHNVCTVDNLKYYSRHPAPLSIARRVPSIASSC